MRHILIFADRRVAADLRPVVNILEQRGHHARVIHDDDASCPARRGDEWRDLVWSVRGIRDYLRYFDNRFERSTKLRKRALMRFVHAASAGTMKKLSALCPSCATELRNDELAGMLAGLGPAGLGAVDELFRMTEETIASDSSYETFLTSEHPDAVIVTSLTSFGSPQTDIVKSCRALRIPVALMVPTFDSLSTKGLIHVAPDRVFTWNEVQRREAVDMHNSSPASVTLTGSPRFDRFLGLEPAESRQGFCARNGFDGSKPIVTYLCSSDFVSKDEAAFVNTWIDRIRQHADLAGCGIVVRPHPRARRTWENAAAREWHRAVLVAPGLDADASLYAALVHSNAAVGLNTSAEIEAGLLGKPTLTLECNELAPGQTDTVHYHYLLKENGGFVEPARDMDEHVRQLAAAVRQSAPCDSVRRSASSFVRPLGMDTPVAPLMADAVESLVYSA